MKPVEPKLRPIPDIPSKAALLALPKADRFWDLELKSILITATARRLRARWTPEENQQVLAMEHMRCFDPVGDAYEYP